MPDSPDPSAPDEKAGADDKPSPVLVHLVQRLKSQPLLLALGVLLILAGVASASLEGLRALLPATIIVFVVAVAAWVAIELARLRRTREPGAGESVRMSARRVGAQGEVLGIDDATGAPAAGSTKVQIKADGVEGKVIGIRRGNPRP